MEVMLWLNLQLFYGKCSINPTFKALEPYTWLRHVPERLPLAQSLADYEALLPWNCSLEMPR